MSSEHVFIISEWLAKESHDQELWQVFKELMAVTLENEPGCLKAQAMRQISHPNATGRSQYKIILFQEYINLEAFEKHCASNHVKNLVKNYIENSETSIVEDWSCRLFSEQEQDYLL